MQKADYLLRLMKQQTDALVAKDEKLQQFLMWVKEKSLSVDLPYKPAAVRAFYFAVAVGRDLGLPSDSDRNRDIALVFNLDVYFNNDFDIVLDFNLSRLLVRFSGVPIAIYQNNYEMILRIHDDKYQFFANISALNLPLELRQALEKVKEQRNYSGFNIFSKMWWQPNKIWIKRLRDVLLQQYYYANLLLVDCLNNNSDVIPAVRSHIEDTLLLPIAEIEKHK
jgi:hypothetical protein